MTCIYHPQHTTNPVAFATPPRTVGTGKTTTSASPSDAKSFASGITSPGTSSAATPPAGVKNIAQRFEAILSAGTGKHAGPASPMTPLKSATGLASVANMAKEPTRQVTTASGATAASMSSGTNPNAAKTTSSVGSARVKTTNTSNGTLRTEVSSSGGSSASTGSSVSRTARPASAPSAGGSGVKNLAQLFAASAAGAHGGAASASASAAGSDPGAVVILAEELSRRKLEQIGLGSLKNLNFSKTGTQAGEGESKGKLLDKVHTEASKVCKEYGVSVTKDGRIDERCAAWRRGNIFYDAKGNIADNVGGKLASEMYYQNTVGAHMEGWQEYAASLKGTGVTLTMDELKQVISSINADDTVRAGVHEGMRSC